MNARVRVWRGVLGRFAEDGLDPEHTASTEDRGVVFSGFINTPNSSFSCHEKNQILFH